MGRSGTIVVAKAKENEKTKNKKEKKAEEQRTPKNFIRALALEYASLNLYSSAHDLK